MRWTVDRGSRVRRASSSSGTREEKPPKASRMTVIRSTIDGGTARSVGEMSVGRPNVVTIAPFLAAAE